jgi:hypothetical protein
MKCLKKSFSNIGSDMLIDPFVIYAGTIFIQISFYKQISPQQKRTLPWILIFDEKQEKVLFIQIYFWGLFDLLKLNTNENIQNDFPVIFEI